MAKDYYKTLGVEKSASQDEIQKAYRVLARKYHPDLNKDDRAAKKKFQDVQQAFEVLGDATKRQKYDRFGAAFEGAERPGGAPNWGPGGPAGAFEGIDLSQLFGGGEGGGGFGDLFGQFRRGASGGSRRGGGRARAPDLEYEAQVPFVTAITGGKIQLELPRPSGKIDSISVTIPPGVEDGAKIRLRGQGDATAEGSSSHLLLTIRVQPHPWFTRRGDNLHVRVPLSLVEAIDGAKVDVPTPKGTVSLKVPPGSTSGTKLRIKGHGVAVADKPAGDLFAEIQIVAPKKLDADLLERLRKIEREKPTEPRQDLHW